MFNIGDVIDYGFFSNVKIVGKTNEEYILRDKNGNIKKVYRSLIDKSGKLVKCNIEYSKLKIKSVSDITKIVKTSELKKDIKYHELKIKSLYFNDILQGVKNFELRKDDRDFKVGDYLILQEFDENYTGRSILVEIIYKLNGGKYGLQEGYCILGFKPVQGNTIETVVAHVYSGLCDLYLSDIDWNNASISFNIDEDENGSIRCNIKLVNLQGKVLQFILMQDENI